ncbi:MAG: hypothetical protein PUC65_04470 [Clostridiales bacterium]|nr:hypothetical protein [Clostridiales bacterium]
MSWDVFLVRTKTKVRTYGEVTDENVICFSRDEVIDEIRNLVRDYGFQVEDIDQEFVYLRGDGWSIEFCFYEDYEPFDIIEMGVRGVKEPTVVFRRLEHDFNARIYDVHGGKFLDEDGTSGFDEWIRFTDKIIADINRKIH